MQKLGDDTLSTAAQTVTPFLSSTSFVGPKPKLDKVVSCSASGPDPGKLTSLQGDGASGLSNSPGGPQCHPVLCQTQSAAAAATQSAW